MTLSVDSSVAMMWLLATIFAVNEALWVWFTASLFSDVHEYLKARTTPAIEPPPTPDALLQAAERFMQHLLQVPKDQKDAYLIDLARADPALHTVVSQRRQAAIEANTPSVAEPEPWWVRFCNFAVPEWVCHMAECHVCLRVWVGAIMTLGLWLPAILTRQQWTMLPVAILFVVGTARRTWPLWEEKDE